MGPKIQMKDKCPLRVTEEEEELDAGDGWDVEVQSKTSLKHSKKVVYKKKTGLRQDIQGNYIKKGGQYGICFDTSITVCVFERMDEVTLIKESLKECES